MQTSDTPMKRTNIANEVNNLSKSYRANTVEDMKTKTWVELEGNRAKLTTIDMLRLSTSLFSTAEDYRQKLNSIRTERQGYEKRNRFSLTPNEAALLGAIDAALAGGEKK